MFLLSEAKRLSGCDKLLCIMSGCFTQRGEISISDKFIRARHAVSGGADCVLELPAVFSVAPAEIFAKGAIKILSSIPAVSSLAFGCEDADKTLFEKSAEILLNESAEFKAELQNSLDRGESYIKSYQAAFIKAGGPDGFLNKPNNILGLEYTKAIAELNAGIGILPIKRVGADYSDENLIKNYSSAGAIRSNLSSQLVKDNVPDFVYADLPRKTYGEAFERLVRLDLLRSETEKLKRIYGCGEGLENRLVSLAREYAYGEIVENCVSKRYSAARIKRILCANSLSIYSDDCKEYLGSKLYLKPLALKKEGADETFALLAQSDFPTVVRGRDTEKLCAAAKKCLNTDERAYDIYRALTNSRDNGNLIII